MLDVFLVPEWRMWPLKTSASPGSRCGTISFGWRLVGALAKSSASLHLTPGGGAAGAFGSGRLHPHDRAAAVASQ